MEESTLHMHGWSLAVPAYFLAIMSSCTYCTDLKIYVAMC